MANGCPLQIKNMKKEQYTLPEWVFLDGVSHQGDLLKGRTVIQHIRTYSIIECVCLDDMADYHFTGKTQEFSFVNQFGVKERHLLALHFTLDEYHIDEIFEAAESWYCSYMKWEDKNIDVENKAIHN